jgi:hypothetical protein
MFCEVQLHFFVVGVNVSGNGKCYFVKKNKKKQKNHSNSTKKFSEPHSINMLGVVVVVIVW